MTNDDILKAQEEIRQACMDKDWSEADKLELRLYFRILQAIKNGAENPAELARIATESNPNERMYF